MTERINSLLPSDRCPLCRKQVKEPKVFVAKSIGNMDFKLSFRGKVCPVCAEKLTGEHQVLGQAGFGKAMQKSLNL